MGQRTRTRTSTKNQQTVKKKEKIDLLELGNAHSKTYNNITQFERLNCLNISVSSFKRMQRDIRDRLRRESCIADEDIEQAVKQIVDYPYLGGKKGSLKLQCDEKALIGSTTYQALKQQLKALAARELLRRKQESELAVDQYKRQREKEEPFAKVAPQDNHDVWAIDFLNLLLFGVYFRICVVYDIYSQSYLSIIPAINATCSVAEHALEQACSYSGRTPNLFLLSDNGSQFISDDFEKAKEKLNIQSRFIPRGQPWYNGALESGNRDFRKVLYTTAFYEACNKTHLAKVGANYDKIFQHLQSCCGKAQTIINEEIARVKFNTTPIDVLNNQVREKAKQRIEFVTQKRLERTQRMKALKQKNHSTRRTIEDKLAFAWKKISKQMSAEQLFAFTEILNNRFRAVTV
jgi:transposase InsO family protein